MAIFHLDCSWLQLPTTSCCWSPRSSSTLTQSSSSKTRRTRQPPACNNEVELGTEEERQPINENEAVNAVITEQPKPLSSPAPDSVDGSPFRKGQKGYDLDADKTFLCGAKTKVREDQVDLCPRLWWANLNPCQDTKHHQHSNPTNSCNSIHDEVEGEGGHGVGRCKLILRWMWRICFITVCLPMCYPCYLTRTIRRRKKTSDYMYLEHELMSGQYRGNKLNETMQRQVTLHRNKTKNSDDDEENATEGPDNSKVINVNVIVIHSQAGRILHKYLKGCSPLNVEATDFSRSISAPADVVDSVSAGSAETFHSFESSSSSRSLSFGASSSTRRSGAPQFAPNLSAVQEEDSLNHSTISNNAASNNGIQQDELKEEAVHLLPNYEAKMSLPSIAVSEEVDGIVVIKKHESGEDQSEQRPSMRRKSSMSARFAKMVGLGDGRASLRRSFVSESSAGSPSQSSASPVLLRRLSRKFSRPTVPGGRKLSRQLAQDADSSEYGTAVPEEEAGVQFRMSRYAYIIVVVMQYTSHCSSMPVCIWY